MTDIEVGDRVAILEDFPNEDGTLGARRTGEHAIVTAVDTDYVLVKQYGSNVVYGKNQVEKVQT